MSRRASSSDRRPSGATTWASAIRIGEPAHARARRGARRRRPRRGRHAQRGRAARARGSGSRARRASSASRRRPPASRRSRSSPADRKAAPRSHRHRPRAEGRRRRRRRRLRRPSTRRSTRCSRRSVIARSPGVDREPRPGLRLGRGGARALERAGGRGGRVRRRDRGRGRRRAAARRVASRAARVLALRAGRALPLPVREPHPARARARLERRDDRRSGSSPGAAAAGTQASADELLVEGARFEGHVDNLAAVLYGGVCVSWKRDGAPRARADRGRPAARAGARRPGSAHEHRAVAQRPPVHRQLTTTPPRTPAPPRCSARRSPPATPTLLRDAFHDRLHEQYRLARRRSSRSCASPAGRCDRRHALRLRAVGRRLGRAAPRRRGRCRARAVRSVVPTVLPLRVAQEGAHVQ